MLVVTTAGNAILSGARVPAKTADYFVSEWSFLSPTGASLSFFWRLAHFDRFYRGQ
jgi:hypothetical protein